jgi:hypothetical protein
MNTNLKLNIMKKFIVALLLLSYYFILFSRQNEERLRSGNHENGRITGSRDQKSRTDFSVYLRQPSW